MGGKLRIGRIADLIEAAEDGLLVGIQAAHELRVVQGFLAVFGSHALPWSKPRSNESVVTSWDFKPEAPAPCLSESYEAYPL